MPFTPFHAGPGLLAKAVSPRLVSLKLFVVTQIAIDIEPLVRMIGGDAILHGWTHGWLGSLVVASAVGLAYQRLWEKLPIPMLLATVLLGAWSHVVLDAWTHPDMLAIWEAIPGTRTIPQTSLQGTHYLCTVLGGFGAVIVAARVALNRWPARERVQLRRFWGSMLESAPWRR